LNSRSSPFVSDPSTFALIRRNLSINVQPKPTEVVWILIQGGTVRGRDIEDLELTFLGQYVWEEFTMEYPRLARAIKVATFSGFLAISDEEEKITSKVRELFASDGFDVKSYVTMTQQQRLQQRRSAEAQANARIDAAMRSAFRNANNDEEEAEEEEEEEEKEEGLGSDYETEVEGEIRE
jgi:hypothetical protein